MTAAPSVPVTPRVDLPTWSTPDPVATITVFLIVVVASLACDAYRGKRRAVAATLALVDLALIVSFVFDVRP